MARKSKVGKPVADTYKITPDDIESKIRDIQGQLEVVGEDSKKKAALVGSIGAVVLLLLIYIFGRRAGVRKSTVVEIRRL